MKKRTIHLCLFSAIVLMPLVATSCQGTTPPVVEEDNVTIDDKDFVIDENYEANLGETIVVEPVTVRDSEKKYHKSEITITDPDNQSVALQADNSFVASKIGVYTVTHTVKYGKNNDKKIEKSFKITIVDALAPVLAEDSIYRGQNLVKLNTEIDLSNLKFEDNDTKPVTVTYKVNFGEEEVALTDNKFVASKEGCYVVTANVKDSSNNEEELLIKFFTKVDGEQGIILDNEFQGGVSLIEGKSFNGTKALNYHWTSEHAEWVNGTSLLASDCGMINTDDSYLSFWYYYDNGDYEPVINSISKYVYYETKVFDEYGNPVKEYWQFPNSYELTNNKWYRFVLNLGNATNVGADGGQCVNNPTDLEDVMFGFGFWDTGVGANCSRANPIYIDDIMVTSDLPTDYHEPKKATEIKLNKTTLELEVGTQEKLTATVLPEDTFDKSLTWSVKEGDSVKVEDGLVTGMKEGKSVVQVSANSNPETIATCEVTVTKNTSVEPMPDASKELRIDHEYLIYQEQSKHLGEYIVDKSDLVDYALCHGDVNNYSIVTTKNGDNLCGENVTLSEFGEPINGAGYQSWRCFYNDKDGIVYSVKAKQECFVKIVKSQNLNGWLEGNFTYSVKRDGVIETISQKDISKGDPECDYIHLKEGEEFIFAINAFSADMRNIQNTPDIMVAPLLK